MATATTGTGQAITHLLNGTLASLGKTIPIEHSISSPEKVDSDINIKFGVLIGITGQIKGKLMLNSEAQVFSNIGQAMYGMPLEGEMLKSFSGELGNMLAGGLSTNVSESGILIDITSPTVMDGETNITGFSKGIRVPVIFSNGDSFSIYLMIDE